MRKNKKSVIIAIVAVLLCANFQGYVAAQSSSSSSYRVDQTQFGSGSQDTCPTIGANQYCAQQSTGDLGVGRTSSNNFDAEAGFLTPDEPFLEFVVTGATVDLGQLTSFNTPSYGAAQAGACNCSFYVRSYRSSEYVVTTMSNPPSYSTAMFDAKATTGAPSSDPGVEEFGMNLVANTTLAAFGANPANDPSGSFADGQAFGDGLGGLRDYDDPDEFAYGVGDIIARSAATVGNQAVGKTNYTISYIIKRKVLTEAGSYSMQHDLVVTGTY